ncbi:MAG: UDP-3-O-acyl-N-acetylglucosamine deacetylase [Gemmatimonas sp.]
MVEFVFQKTLKNAITCSGVGLHTGARVAMTLHPAEVNHGIVFRRTDIVRGEAEIAADWRNVVDSTLCTAIANKDGVEIQTIEHLMAAFAGLGIDNVLVELNGPEVPIMDGSAAPFVFLVECAGTVEQAEPRRAVVVHKPIAVTHDGKRASLTPAAGFTVDLAIDFSNTLVARQTLAFDLTDGAFKAEIARARTFGFENEISHMRAAGMLRGGSLENAVVVSGAKVMNEDGLRYDDEFVRHKTLDCLGDLYLAGAPLIGRFDGFRTGHRLNHRLLVELFSDVTAFSIEPMSASLLGVATPDTRPLVAVRA